MRPVPADAFGTPFRTRCNALSHQPCWCCPEPPAWALTCSLWGESFSVMEPRSQSHGPGSIWQFLGWDQWAEPCRNRHNRRSHDQAPVRELLGCPCSPQPFGTCRSGWQVPPLPHRTRGQRPRSHVCSECWARGDLGRYFGQAGPLSLLSGNCLINNTLTQWVQEPLTALC